MARERKSKTRWIWPAYWVIVLTTAVLAGLYALRNPVMENSPGDHGPDADSLEHLHGVARQIEQAPQMAVMTSLWILVLGGCLAVGILLLRAFLRSAKMRPYG